MARPLSPIGVACAGFASAAMMLVLSATGATAQTTVGAFEGSVPIEASAGEGVAINRIVVQAEEPGTIEMVFEDVVLSEDGSWGRVEFGSTPYTLLSYVRPPEGVLRYDGEMVGRRETFDVELRVTGIGEQSRAGLVTYRFVPDSNAGPEAAAGIRNSVAVRVRLGAWPVDLDGIPAAVAVTDLRLRRDRQAITGPIDRIIPDVPGILNRGPAVIQARTTNVGDVLVQSETTLRLARLPWVAAVPLVQHEGSTVITYIDRQRLLLPTESAVSTVASTASLVEGDEIDRLPFFGLVRISAEASAYLGSSRDDARVSRTYLIAPWKEALVLAFLYGAFRAMRRRAATGRRDRVGASTGPASGTMSPQNAAGRVDREDDRARVGAAVEAAPPRTGQPHANHATVSSNGVRSDRSQATPLRVERDLRSGFDDLQERLDRVRALLDSGTNDR